MVVAVLVGIFQVNRAYLIGRGLLSFILYYNHIKAFTAVGLKGCRGLFVSYRLGYLLEHLSHGQSLCRSLLSVYSDLDFGAGLGCSAVGFLNAVKLTQLRADVVSGGFKLFKVIAVQVNLHVVFSNQG